MNKKLKSDRTLPAPEIHHHNLELYVLSNSNNVFIPMDWLFSLAYKTSYNKNTV